MVPSGFKWFVHLNQPVFKKCNIGWPHQPPTENVQFSFTHFNMRQPVNAIGGFPLLQGKNSNKSKIKLFLSQNFPPFFIFYPVWHAVSENLLHFFILNKAL